VSDRIELEVLDEDAVVARARQFQRDQGVLARLRVQDLQQRLGLDRDRRGPLAVAASERAGHLAAAARTPRFIFSERVTCLRFEYCFHC